MGKVQRERKTKTKFPKCLRASIQWLNQRSVKIIWLKCKLLLLRPDGLVLPHPGLQPFQTPKPFIALLLLNQPVIGDFGQTLTTHDHQ